MNAATRLLPLLVLAALPLNACGLGTEVGNGLHPAGQGGGAPSGGSDTANQPATSETPSPARPTGQETSSLPGATPGPASGKADRPWPATQGFDFDLALLTASCASPLAEDIAAPVTLARKAADGSLSNVLVLTEEASAQGSAWTVADESGAVLRKVAKGVAATGAPLPVTAEDASGQAMAESQAICQQVATNPSVQVSGRSGPVSETVATFVLKDRATSGVELRTTVTWDLAPAATPGGKPALIRVVLQGDAVTGGGPVELDAQ